MCNHNNLFITKMSKAIPKVNHTKIPKVTVLSDGILKFCVRCRAKFKLLIAENITQIIIPIHTVLIQTLLTRNTAFLAVKHVVNLLETSVFEFKMSMSAWDGDEVWVCSSQS